MQGAGNGHVPDGTPRSRTRVDDRGRRAARPGEIPARGWKDILARTAKQLKADDVSTQSAAVAFYAILALFPALLALVSLYGLAADPADVRSQLSSFLEAAPTDARRLVTDQLGAITRSASGGLGVGVVVGTAVALWTASSGVKALIKGVNVAYGERETRTFVRLRGLALVLTVLGVVGVAVMLGLVVALPAVLDRVAGDAVRWVGLVLRWPLVALLIFAALAVVYRYAPDRENPEWRWVSWGAVVAAALWLLASIGFSVYVSLLGSYNETYGSLGAIVVLLLWLYLSAFAILGGAELNAEMERQTARDTTTGADRPMGERDAYAADTLGEQVGR